MIRRLLAALADRLMDVDWLRQMREREANALASARRYADERPPASDQWPPRERGPR